MSYEYKFKIELDLEHLSELQTGVWKYEEKLDELDEVYVKAQAFDKCVDLLSVIKTSANPHDLMKAYDEIGKVLQPYVFKEDGTL